MSEICHATQQTFIHFDRPPPSQQAITTVCKQGPSLENHFYSLDPTLKQLEANAFTEWLHFFQQESYKKLHLSTFYPGSIQLFQTLKQQHVDCVIVSNKNNEAIRKILADHALLDVFSAIYCPSLRFPAKPDPTVFTHEILPSYPDYSCDDFLMVGDTHIDCEFAANCEIAMAWATYGYGDEKRCLAQPIAHQLHEPLALLQVLNL